MVHGGAHDASADAPAAVRVAYVIAARHGTVATLSTAELHERQIVWYADRAADFQKFLRRTGTADAMIDGRWPLRELAPTVG